ncbi:MAG: hypothetical protein LBV64_00900 [Mediterranea sp.]|jgi:hypothetical protein|nr:hypothetical protein [Mediterranea sp.]
MCTRAIRADIKIPEKYKILPEESPKLPEVCPKVKESKGNKRGSNSNELHSQPEAVDAPESIDYQKFVDWFNSETKDVFGLVKYPLGEKRKASIRARVREHGKQLLYEAVKKAFESNFLKGDNKRGFTATLDWIIKPSNFDKILSGNYDNGRNKTANSNSGIDTEFMQHVAAGIARAEFDKKKMGDNFELSLYSDKQVEPNSIAVQMARLKASFPKMGELFFDILAERIVSNGFTEKRLKDAVNQVIDSFQYKELNISDIIKFDRRIKLYTYSQVCKMWTSGSATNDEFEIRKIEEVNYWIRKVDLLNSQI